MGWYAVDWLGYCPFWHAFLFCRLREGTNSNSPIYRVLDEIIPFRCTRGDLVSKLMWWERPQGIHLSASAQVRLRHVVLDVHLSGGRGNTLADSCDNRSRSTVFWLWRSFMVWFWESFLQFQPRSCSMNLTDNCFPCLLGVLLLPEWIQFSEAKNFGK